MADDLFTCIPFARGSVHPKAVVLFGLDDEHRKRLAVNLRR
jgi:hypothetical protein